MPISFETRVDHSGRWYLVNVSPGESGIYVIVEDITERKEAERLIAAERKRFNDILEMLPAYLILLDPDYRVPFANRFFRERFGVSGGRRCFEYLFEYGEPCDNCQSYEVLKTGAPKEWEWTGPDGRNYHIYDFPFTDVDGSALIMEMGIDITELKLKEELLRAEIEERKEAEAAVRQSEEKFSKAFHGMPLMMILATIEEGRFIDANEATFTECGYTPEEIIGHTTQELKLFPNMVRADFIARILKEGKVENYEVELRHKSGELRHCLCWTQLIAVEKQLCSMNAVIDITEQIRARKEQEREERRDFISKMAVSLSSRFEKKLQAATEETRQEMLRYKEAFSRAVGLEKIIVSSEVMKATFALAERMHEDRKLPVLIEGETGTGKEVIAKYIHYGDGKVTAPFVALNCAAIAPTIFESELFGYEAGAFTGGLAKGQKGKLDMAKGGTLFLDEITELPLDLQAKLLRVLQENEYFRVGGQKVIPTDVRIICATNQSIEAMVAEGKFRQDLYYRLNVGRIHLPPLRERAEDILPLAYSFLTDFAEEKGSKLRSISKEAADILMAYEWPGNVREIRNAMQRVVLLWDGWEVKGRHLDFLQNGSPDSQSGSPAALNLDDMVLPLGGLPIEDVYNTIVRKALELNKGNKSKTAQYLQISRNSLTYRLKQMEEKL